MFSLSQEQLELLLGGSAFIFEQAAYATTPPEDLRSELNAAGLTDGVAAAFSSTWQLGADECVRRLKEQSVLAPLQERHRLQLCVGTAAIVGVKDARALLQLDFSATRQRQRRRQRRRRQRQWRRRSRAGASGEAKGVMAGESALPGTASQTVHMRLGREEMSALLGKLDLIQTQMDAIA